MKVQKSSTRRETEKFESEKKGERTKFGFSYCYSVLIHVEESVYACVCVCKNVGMKVPKGTKKELDELHKQSHQESDSLGYKRGDVCL